MRDDDFCFILDSFHHQSPNQLGDKPFYLLFRHSSGIVGEVTDLEDAMKRAREYAQASRYYEYVVMKAVAIVRSAPQQLEEIMLDDKKDNNAH